MTPNATELERTSGVRDWVKAHAASKWSCAGHAAVASGIMGMEGDELERLGVE